MTEKTIIADCENCESTFEVSYSEEFVSADTPNFCPFCGEEIEVQEYEEEEDLDDEEDEDDGEGW